MDEIKSMAEDMESLGYDVSRAKEALSIAEVFMADGVRKRGRPSTGFNKTSYMKEYMRKRRQEARNGQPAKR